MRGIYQITCLANSERTVYVGSTINFKQRWQQHRTDLRRNVHKNPHLQAAWNKYGESAFEFGVLEYLNNPEELHLSEQFWMDIYREEGRELYNCGLIARNGMLARNHTKEAKEKMSAAQKGRKLSKEAARKLHESWRGKHHTEEICKRISTTKAKPYPSFVHQVTGEIIPSGMNLLAMTNKYGLNRGHMREVIAGERKHHHDWILMEEE